VNNLFAHLLELPTAAGLITTLAGAGAVRTFVRRPPRRAAAHPPVTVMKPLSGDEPLLEEALSTMCAQTYPHFQIVFGVQDPNDPALQAVARLRARFPHRDIAVTVSDPSPGPNHKVCNLINMLPAARHDILVFSDSDMHVGPDYLDNVVATLLTPGTGLVTTLCVGKPTVPGLMARLGATQITHCFLPGVLLARAIGRQDCLGTTMALTRATLERIGGLTALVDHLADDNVLGQLVQRQQMRVALADVVPATGVADRGPRGLWQHELRWNRTIRGLEPAALAASVVQFPLFWATLACVGSALSARSVGMFAFSWAIRALAAWWIDGSLRLTGRDRSPFGALPLRDILSVVEIVASFMTDNVVWRGRSLLTGKTGSLTQY
jgi:ceramide glucosyltransferase